MKNNTLISVVSVLVFSLVFGAACRKQQTDKGNQASKDLKAHLKNFGTYHNNVLYRAAEWQDSINRLHRASTSAGSLLSFNSLGDPAAFDPIMVAHDLTISTLFNTNQTLFDPETEMELADQALQLTDQAVASGEIANPNEVVRMLLGSEDFYSLSPKEQGYFMRLTEIFKTNDYGAMAELLNSEMNSFNNESWSEDEGNFVQGFKTICQ